MSTRVSSRRNFFLAVSVVACALSAASGIALAQGAALKVNAEVMMIHATIAEGKGGIDPRIGDVKALSKPPFSAYNTFALLDKQKIPLEKGKSSAFPLANGGTLKLTLVALPAESKDKRFGITAAIEDGKGKVIVNSDVTASPNEPFFFGGQSYRGGSLILGVTVRP